jgi:hypothetical protein
MSYILLLFALLQWALFESDYFSPIPLSLVLIALASIDVVRRFLRGGTGLIGAAGYVVLMSPFVHLITYLWFDFERDAPMRMWGVAANEYMWDARIGALLAMMGASAACAYAAGLGWLGRFQAKQATPTERARPMSFTPMTTPVYALLAAAATAFAWLSAPQETILTAIYTASAAPAEALNFSSAGFLGYIILLFLLTDAVFDPQRLRRALKLALLAGAALVVVFWLQLMRGDRESLTFVLAGFAVVYYWADLARYDRPGIGLARLHRPTLVVGGFALYVVYYVVGIVRGALQGSGSLDDLSYAIDELVGIGKLGVDNFLVGTWTGALMSPLSVAGDYVLGRLPMRHGTTYVDILLSTPPGFVADWFGYERPIDGTKGPAFEMIYGLGGTHAVVVPFMNFGMGGIVVILLAWAVLLNLLDRSIVRAPGYFRFCLCAVMLGVLPHWFWYGEKNVINVLILWALLSAGIWSSSRLSHALRAG